MKRTSKVLQPRQRNTVTFCSAQEAKSHAPSDRGGQNWSERIKWRKDLGFVKFQKLQICGLEQKSEQQRDSQPPSEQGCRFSQNQLAFKGRSQLKTFTQYKSQNPLNFSRIPSKKNTMIPIKMQSPIKNEAQIFFISKRFAKSSEKGDDKNSISNVSIKSIQSKHSRIKRDTESMWSISTNKIISNQVSRRASKFLEREGKEMQELEKQCRYNLRIFKHEGYKRMVLKQLVTILQKELNQSEGRQQKEKSDIESRKNKTRINETSELLSIDLDSKICSIQKVINQVSKKQNLILSQNSIMKQQILSHRKQRAIYSTLINNIQKEIKQQEKVYYEALIMNTNKLYGVQNLELEKGKNPQIKYATQNTLFTEKQFEVPSFHFNQIDKKESIQEDTIQYIQNYHSFELPDFAFYQNDEQKLKVLNDGRARIIIKPRKKLSFHSFKATKKDLVAEEIKLIHEFQLFIEKMSILLEVQPSKQTPIGEKVKSKLIKVPLQNSSYFKQILQVNQEIEAYQRLIYQEQTKKKQKIMQIQLEIEEKQNQVKMKKNQKQSEKNSEIFDEVLKLMFQVNTSTTIEENQILSLIQKLQQSYQSLILQTIEEKPIKKTNQSSNQTMKTSKQNTRKQQSLINSKIHSSNKENQITFCQISSQIDKLRDSQSIFHQLQSKNEAGSKNFNTLSSIENFKRHSPKISTLINNMAIYQSYEKVFSRFEFENQYVREVLEGKKKKKVQLKRVPVGITAK